MSQKQSNEDALGCQYCSIGLIGGTRPSKFQYRIIIISVGLMRCSFRLIGQCEGLYIVERAENRLHVLYVCVNEFIKTSAW